MSAEGETALQYDDWVDRLPVVLQLTTDAISYEQGLGSDISLNFDEIQTTS